MARNSSSKTKSKHSSRLAMVKTKQRSSEKRVEQKKTGPDEDDVIRTKPMQEVTGANLPWEVLNGFIHRIWHKHNIDKVSFMPNGIFLVRFKEGKDRDEILKAGHFMFDNKPLIFRPWTEETELTKEDVKNVPIWVRIQALHLKYWGKCLPSIAGLLGDFNTVITPDERLGGNTKQADMDEFIECLANCGVTDLAATGAFYTWTNKQEPQTRVYSRLDRFLVNQEWQDQFPDMLAHYHPAGLFDHSLCTVSNAKLDITKRASFIYFNMWGRAPSFIPTVKDEWEKVYLGHKMFSVIKKLKALKPILKQLNKECYADIENSTSIAEKELEAIQLQIESDPQNAELIQQEMEISDKLKDMQAARISYLKQKAKVQWLEEGDCNTAYFHGAIRKRCSVNKVIQIENQYWKQCTDSHSIQEAFLDYYQSLLGSRKATEKVRSQVIDEGR
ncbi:uncharacterized protein LOC141641489 [Silene latifolia]|uniref:uncharacterized protein LOC141641489 n=1 Tax=Silene latifolia TaxID=37657 RepID=UPI003D787B5C